MLLAYFYAENYFTDKNPQKLLQAELLFMAQISTKLFGGWGFAPDLTGEAYSAPPDPLAVFRGPTSKARKRGEEGREKSAYRDDSPQTKFLNMPLVENITTVIASNGDVNQRSTGHLSYQQQECYNFELDCQIWWKLSPWVAKLKAHF